MPILPEGTTLVITTLTGANSFSLKAELNRQVSEFVKEHSDMALEKLDGEEVEFDRIRESLQSLPFLAARKLVVLRTPSAQKQFIEQADNLLTELPETTDVILIEPKLDKRSGYYKFLKTKTVFHEYSEMDDRALSTWLVQSAKNQGGSLKPGEAHYLVERVGMNQQMLAKELEKLLSYQPNVSRQAIDLLTEPAPQSTVFQLLDAALHNRPKRALELYEEQRAQKVEPYAIIAMLAWQLHVVAVVKAAGSSATQRDDVEIAREAKLNPFVVRKSRQIAEKLSMLEVKALVEKVLKLDIRLKTESIDPDEALRNLLISLAAKE